MSIQKKKSINIAPLEDAINNNSNDKISIEDIMTAMNSGGFGLVLMVFALPILIPLPPPFPSLISVPLVIFSFQMVIGLKAPKLPKKISQKTIKRVLLANIIEKSSIYFAKAEKVLKPRLTFLSRGIFERIVGFFILIFATSVLLPLPLSNFIPGVGILVTSFGLIGKDGAIIILGLLIGLTGIAIMLTAVFLGVEFFGIMKDFISHLF